MVGVRLLVSTKHVRRNLPNTHPKTYKLPMRSRSRRLDRLNHHVQRQVHAPQTKLPHTDAIPRPCIVHHALFIAQPTPLPKVHVMAPFFTAHLEHVLRQEAKGLEPGPRRLCVAMGEAKVTCLVQGAPVAQHGRAASRHWTCVDSAARVGFLFEGLGAWRPWISVVFVSTSKGRRRAWARHGKGRWLLSDVRTFKS